MERVSVTADDTVAGVCLGLVQGLIRHIQQDNRFAWLRQWIADHGADTAGDAEFPLRPRYDHLRDARMEIGEPPVSRVGWDIGQDDQELFASVASSVVVWSNGTG